MEKTRVSGLVTTEWWAVLCVKGGSEEVRTAVTKLAGICHVFLSRSAQTH